MEKLFITNILLLLFIHPVIGSANSATDSARVEVISITPNTAVLKTKIYIMVNNLSSLVKEANDTNKKIIPYIDGLPLKDLKIYSSSDSTLELFLCRSDVTRENWATILAQRDNFYSGKVDLSVGLEDKKPIPTIDDGFEIIFARKSWVTGCILVFLVIFVLFIWLAHSSNILRDSGPSPKEPYMKPFSIGRSQMAFWFFLIIVSFPIIWLVTGQPSEITGSILVLMGISSGTALGAAAIDTNKFYNLKAKKTAIEAEKEVLNPQIVEVKERLNSIPPPLDSEALKVELNKKTIRVLEITKIESDNTMKNIDSGRKTQGFLKDILSDTDGVSFHRFQMLTWTIVLGAIFIIEVKVNLRMPQFSDTFLALMGISAGTYLGFKFPEQQPPAESELTAKA